MPDPAKTIRRLLFVVLISTSFLNYWEYSKAFHSNPDIFNLFLRGGGNAPQQYRVGVIQLASVMSQHSRLGLRHGIALIDCISAFVAVFVLFSLLQRALLARAASRQTQWIAYGAYLFLVQFYFSWMLWYQRPETFTTAASAALLLWLLTPHPALSSRARVPLLLTATALVAFVQGLVRADVVVALEAGVVLVCLVTPAEGLALPRWFQAATSAVAVLVAGGVQFYLMRVVYPNVTYGDIPMFQLKMNVTDTLRLVPFFLFMTPYFWLLRRWSKSSARGSLLNRPSVALLPGSILFLGLWCLFGRLDEVRIMLPFTLALAPFTALLLAGTTEDVEGEPMA